MSANSNIFVDFSIVTKSNPKKLKEEFDLLIQFKNQIFIWSKTILPESMRAYCLSVKFVDPNEAELHKNILKLRKEKKPFKEISDVTGVPLWKLSYYLVTRDTKVWTLDDWIKDYYKKDSSIYPKVDFVIDPDQKLVDRFQTAGLDGNCIEKIT